jgi:uncharacterized lipoprotein NlpE involved in copper resistance
MIRFASAVVVLLALGGCASNSVVGTWTGRGGTGSDLSFGSVSFVGDQTFTAEARYGGQTRVQSGTWSATGDRLTLMSDGTQREYGYKVSDDELVVTDGGSNASITLDRLQKK